MYYFFITSEEIRNSKKEPTLRALPNQKLNGNPIDTNLNVRAPKEKGTAEGGTRGDYPFGTIFCSDYLAIDNSKKTPFYTVYKDEFDKPNFHPVSSDPNFQYVSPLHKNDKMNAAYALFEMGFDPNVNKTEEPKTDSVKENTAAVYTPADEQGKARAKVNNWKERYAGQIEEEAQLFAKWLRGLFNENRVTPMTRIMMSSVMDIFRSLYECGESIDTIASRSRFDEYLKSEKTSFSDLAILESGPHKSYLTWLLNEHNGRTECTAKERDAQKPAELADAFMMIQQAHSDLTGNQIETNLDTVKASKSLQKAFADGWTLDDLLDPENLKKSASFSSYISDLEKGTITPPEKIVANGASYIEMLMAEKKNKKPSDKDGFHVEEPVWRLLVRNMNRKVNTMLTGPSGCGKTEIVKLLCKRTGMPLTIIQMGTITDPTEQLIGKMDIDSLSGGTVFDWAEFAKAIQKPGVILLDEINRIPKNGENILFSCLDKTRELSASGAKSSDKRLIPVHPDCWFVATANIGDEFTGTKEIDAAHENRFMKVELDYLTQALEKKMLVIREGIAETDAENITLVATQIRSLARKEDMKSVSTRYTLECASLVKDGFNSREAMEMIFLPIYDAGSGPNDSSSERAQIKSIIQQRFNNTVNA